MGPHLSGWRPGATTPTLVALFSLPSLHRLHGESLFYWPRSAEILVLFKKIVLFPEDGQSEVRERGRGCLHVWVRGHVHVGCMCICEPCACMGVYVCVCEGVCMWGHMYIWGICAYGNYVHA